MTLKNRINIAFLILGFFLVFNGFLAFYSGKKMFLATMSLTYKDLPSVVENSKMNGIAKDMRALVYRLHLKNSTEDIVSKIESRFLELKDQYNASKNEYLAVPFANEKEKALFTNVDKNFSDWINVTNKLFEIKKANFNSEEFEIVLTSNYRESANLYLSSMTEFLDELSAQSKRKITVLEETNKKNEYVLIASTIIGLIVAVGGSVLISKSTGQILENLYSTFQVKYMALFESCKSGDLLSSKNLKRVDQQASALEQTTAATQETYRSIEGVSSQAQKLKDQTKSNIEFLNISSLSLNDLDSAIKSVSEINEKLNIRLDQNNDDLGKILNIFGEIENKTKLINDIVFQTKLLSFNASVEAARAGEHGKGFTVVAREINELASKSGNSSTEIFSLLQDSQKSINGLIKNSTQETQNIVNEFNKIFDSCIELSNGSKDKIQLSINSINDSFDFVNQINESTHQQVLAISQISDAMTGLQEINRENEVGTSDTVHLLTEIRQSAIDIDTSIKQLVYGNKSKNGG